MPINLSSSWLIGGPRLTWDDHRKLDGLIKLQNSGLVVVVALVVVVLTVACGNFITFTPSV